METQTCVLPYTVKNSCPWVCTRYMLHNVRNGLFHRGSGFAHLGNIGDKVERDTRCFNFFEVALGAGRTWIWGWLLVLWGRSFHNELVDNHWYELCYSYWVVECSLRLMERLEASQCTRLHCLLGCWQVVIIFSFITVSINFWRERTIYTSEGLLLLAWNVGSDLLCSVPKLGWLSLPVCNV